MENIVENLFGLSPLDVQQQQRQSIDTAANAYGNQDPYQRANSGWYRAGAAAGDAGANMFGMVNPQVGSATPSSRYVAS